MGQLLDWYLKFAAASVTRAGSVQVCVTAPLTTGTTQTEMPTREKESVPHICDAHHTLSP